jgi:hypothetical protein
VIASRSARQISGAKRTFYLRALEAAFDARRIEAAADASAEPL